MEEMANNEKKADLPPVVEAILGVLSMVLICAVGFGVWFAIDILLLDFDPIGKLCASIF